MWCNFPSYGAEHRGLVLHRTLAPMALGRAVDDPAALWRELAMRTHVLAAQSGDAGALSAALAGLDAALWDLKARRAGLPLARLLGGEVSEVPAHASGLNPGDGPETAERARGEGYRRFKQKIGFGEEVDLKNLRRIASDLQEGEALLVDANQGWTTEEALSTAPRLNELPLGWVEEPILADRPGTPAAPWPSAGCRAGPACRPRCPGVACSPAGAVLGPGRQLAGHTLCERAHPAGEVPAAAVRGRAPTGRCRIPGLASGVGSARHRAPPMCLPDSADAP